MWTREFVRHIATENDVQRERKRNLEARGEEYVREHPQATLDRWIHLAQQIEREREGCSECRSIHDSGHSLAPTHQASVRCQSGGRAHCTCDTCF
jgi:hypothetical protein